jgi:pyruvate dehydrogenase E2 component (dihydrolipoamide acetyltransferase)
MVAAAVLAWRRLLTLGDPRPDAVSATAPREEEAGAVLPADARVAWVPGPAGGIRLCERNADQRQDREQQGGARQGSKRQGGARAEMVFVHGLGGRLEHWAAQLEALGPALTGVALDLPGHGGSDRSDDADAVVAAAAALGAAIDACTLRRPLVVAHGWGCLAALRWAAAHPRRARGLLLLDPPGDQSRMAAEDVAVFRQAVADDPRGELRLFLRQSLAEVPEALANHLLADVEATDDAVLRCGLEASTHATPAADAEAADVPIHVATSDLGRGPQSLEALVPSVVPWHLQGGGHWLMLANPERFNQLLDDVSDTIRDSH